MGDKFLFSLINYFVDKLFGVYGKSSKQVGKKGGKIEKIKKKKNTQTNTDFDYIKVFKDYSVSVLV